MSKTITGVVKCQTSSLTGTIVDTQHLVGQITYESHIVGQITSESHIVGSLATAYNFVGDKYTGDYEVTPTVDGVDLETKHKYMTDNVTIFSIPYFEVSNNSGGNTVYIADELEKGNL